VSDEQAVRVGVAFAREAAKAPRSRWCSACVSLLDVDGAGITLMGGDRAGPMCVSNSRMAALEEWQFTAGEGPCRDAFQRGLPVLTPRFDEASTSRWPSFVDLAHTSGIGSVFAYPLSTKGTTVGVLTLYQDGEGDLTDQQHSDSLIVGEVIAEAVLSLQAAAKPGTLAPELDMAAAYRAEIYQAAGMVAVQLQIPVSEAIARIRAFAFANDRPVSEVAADIVARRLRLTNDRQDEGSQQ